MSDSGSSIGETRMLERRVSNNRADLSGDQQMNHFLAWFNTWSELQKTDFVSVLAGKMSSATSAKAVNGVADRLGSMDFRSSRPPSLFSCQIKLFHEYFSGWSDDQKNYLVLRLRDIDPVFFEKYEAHLQNPDQNAPKDYFEPGIPEEAGHEPHRHKTNGGKCDYEDDYDDHDSEDSLKKHSSSSAPLSPASGSL